MSARTKILCAGLVARAWVGAATTTGCSGTPDSHDRLLDAGTHYDAGQPDTSSDANDARVDIPDVAPPDALVGRDPRALLRPLRTVPNSPKYPYVVRIDPDGIYVAAEGETDAGRDGSNAVIVRLSADGSAPPLEIAAPHAYIRDFVV